MTIWRPYGYIHIESIYVHVNRIRNFKNVQKYFSHSKLCRKIRVDAIEIWVFKNFRPFTKYITVKPL